MRKIFFIIFIIFILSGLSYSQEGVINISKSSNQSIDARIAVNQNNWIMIVWTEVIGGRKYIYYAVNKGDSWSNPARIPGQSSADNILPDISKGRTGGFSVVWHDEGGCNCIKFVSYNGNSWTKPVIVSQHGGYEMGKPRITTTNKRICVIWDVGNPLFSDAFVNVWDGRWSGVKQISITGYHHAAKVADVYYDKSGRFHATWEEVRDKSATEDMLEIVYTHDDGHNRWVRPVDLTSFQETCFRPTIAVDNNNNVLVTYFKSRAYRCRIQKNGHWSEHMIIGTGGHEHELYYSDAASIGNGFLFVWRNLSYQVQYSIWNGENWSAPYSLSGYNTYHPAVDYSKESGAVVTWTDRDQKDVVFLQFDVNGSEPQPNPNIPPVARFKFSPKTGLYPLKIHFDASDSYDSDGEIVKYRWNFSDGSGASGKITDHTFSKKGIFNIRLVVTDNEGATGDAFGTVEVLGLFSPLNQHYELKENRTLFTKEYLYKITWDRNPRNAEIGAVITNYKIYKRKKGYSTNYKFLIRLSADQFEYLDRSLGSERIEYEYRITAVDTKGRESSIIPDSLYVKYKLKKGN
jgi:hypothetical protein